MSYLVSEVCLMSEVSKVSLVSEVSKVHVLGVAITPQTSRTPQIP